MNGMVPASALLSRWYSARLSTAIGIAFSAVGIGTMVFVPLAQQLVSLYDWRMRYRYSASALLALAPLVLLRAVARLRRGPCRPPGAGQAACRASGWTLRSALGTALYWALAQVFFFTSVGDVLHRRAAGRLPHRRGLLAAGRRHRLRHLGMLSSVSVMSSGLTRDRFGYPPDRDRELRRHRDRHAAADRHHRMALVRCWSCSCRVRAVHGHARPDHRSICARHFAGPQWRPSTARSTPPMRWARPSARWWAACCTT
jgi:hypothetical protein